MVSASVGHAQTPKDQTQALSELAVLFFKDAATYRGELLDLRKLDFSLESLRHINEYLGQIREDSEAKKEWNRIILRTGAYVGEVIRRNDKKVSWTWVDYDGAKLVQPQMFTSFGKSVATAAVLYDGKNGFTFPLAKVEKYLNNGPEDNLYFYAQVITAHANQ